MAPPTPATSGSVGQSSTNPKTIDVGTRAVGDVIVVAVHRLLATASTYAVTDDQGNSYSTIVSGAQGANYETTLYYAVVASAGPTTVTISRDAGSGTFACSALAMEPDSGSTISLDAFAGFGAPSGSATKYCAPVGEIDTAADVLIVAAAALQGADSGTPAGPSGYSLAQSPNAKWSFLWHRASSSPLSNERAQWTGFSGYLSAGAIASFKTVPPPPAGNPFYAYAQQ